METMRRENRGLAMIWTAGSLPCSDSHCALADTPGPQPQMTSVPRLSQPPICNCKRSLYLENKEFLGILEKEHLARACQCCVTPWCLLQKMQMELAQTSGRFIYYGHERWENTLQVTTVRTRESLKEIDFSKAFICPILLHPPPAALEIMVINYC